MKRWKISCTCEAWDIKTTESRLRARERITMIERRVREKIKVLGGTGRVISHVSVIRSLFC